MAAGVDHHPFDAIDWSAPWLAPWRAAGQPLALRVQGGEAVCAALHGVGTVDIGYHGPTGGMGEIGETCAAPLQFVPQSDLPAGTAYEQHIFDTRRVPTRDNLHDFFNGLVWLHFPQAKRRLNQLQAGAIAADGVQAVRGPLRDALTVFDENGAVLCGPPALGDALRARDWQRLFVDLRPLWPQARLVLFGHALLEKLVCPRKPMVAHVYIADAALDSIADVDAWLAQQMQPTHWSTKPFYPLPVLGVPGWWRANEAPGFYADVQVFRPARGLG